MGLLSTILKRRRQRKALEKAAKFKAKQEVRANAKLEKRKEAYLRKTAKQVRKMDAKQLKERRRHEEKMATAAVQQMRAGRFTARNVMRYTGAARVLAPIAIPLIYRAITQLQGYEERSVAHRAGVKTSKLAKFQGRNTAASERARIEALRKQLDDKRIPSGFAKDINDRLDDLDNAASNAQSMNAEQAERVLESIRYELNLVDQELVTKLS